MQEGPFCPVEQRPGGELLNAFIQSCGSSMNRQHRQLSNFVDLTPPLPICSCSLERKKYDLSPFFINWLKFGILFTATLSKSVSVSCKLKNNYFSPTLFVFSKFLLYWLNRIFTENSRKEQIVFCSYVPLFRIVSEYLVNLLCTRMKLKQECHSEHCWQ